MCKMVDFLIHVDDYEDFVPLIYWSLIENWIID